jgi:RNA polymerase sigma-70 factor (ECF subfamily)
MKWDAKDLGDMTVEETPEQPLPDISLLEEQRRIAAALAGDLSAFDVLMGCHGPKIRSIVRRFFPDSNDADDAVQETFIRAYQNLSRFEGHSSLRTWLIGIAVNVCRNKRRKTWLHRVVLIEDYSLLEKTQPASEGFAEAFSRKEELEQALSQLPDNYRLPLLLRYLEDLTGAEIAAALGWNESTVWSRIYEGCRRLRKKLGAPE